MIYIYTDFGGTHTTSLAAAYHLNKLPTDRKLTKEEILNVDYFNKLKTEDMGKLFSWNRRKRSSCIYDWMWRIKSCCTSDEAFRRNLAKTLSKS